MYNLVKKAVILSWITIIYNIIEGIISIAFGVSESSTSLAGFWVDSLIEVASGVVVLWSFMGEIHKEGHSDSNREKKAIKGIGILFIILATILSITSVHQLFALSHPATTIPGIIVSILSLAVMFFLFNAKKSVGTQLNNLTV